MSSLTFELAEALHRVAEAPRLLVALDFDGTLAPTVDHPDDARASEPANDAISILVSAPNTWVALVSGRALASLVGVARVPAGVTLVGSHGAEFRIDGDHTVPELTVEERDVLERLCDDMAAIATEYDGAMAEKKPAGCGLHTRLCTRADAIAAEARALHAVEGMAGGALVAHRRGKDILEFTVRHADKGTAISALRERFDVTAVVFAGDDVTDEDAFVALKDSDVGIKVGDGETSAQYRVADPDEVAELLNRLAAIRAVVHRN